LRKRMRTVHGTKSSGIVREVDQSVVASLVAKERIRSGHPRIPKARSAS
jgi:hypothetical protein